MNECILCTKVLNIVPNCCEIFSTFSVFVDQYFMNHLFIVHKKCWIFEIEMSSKYLRIVFVLIAINVSLWPVDMKSISSNELQDVPINLTGTIDLQPKFRGFSRQMSQISGLAGGIFGGLFSGSWFGASSVKPFIRCKCCKLTLFRLWSLLVEKKTNWNCLICSMRWFEWRGTNCRVRMFFFKSRFYFFVPPEIK